MRRRELVMPVLFTAVLAGCGASNRADRPAADSSGRFAALQSRGAEAMGVDQYTSAHVFEPLPDGGRIVLKRDPGDSAGVTAIRSHMRHIAERFALGDFNIPGFVHAETVSGTTVMAARRAFILYVADTIPGGGQVRITTTDAEALGAVHEFLAFQRKEHHAPAHDHGGMEAP